MPVITLLTDFGLQDVYVGVMKGIILSLNSHVQIVDITHAIPPQNILAGMVSLESSYPYFPPDTIHLIIVDPTVGTERKAIAIRSHKGYFLAPDNGILTPILQQMEIESVVNLNNPNYWWTPNISNTFHGRDIFASVAGYLSQGIPLEDMGERINSDSLTRYPFPSVIITENQIKGCVQWVDRFGNLITNIPASCLSGKHWWLDIQNHHLYLQNTYSNVEKGKLTAIISSNGYLEIAVNQGNAHHQLQLSWGDTVIVNFTR